MEVTLEKVIGKSVLDVDFRSQLLAAPEKALQSLGWVLNESELKQLLSGISNLQANGRAETDELFTQSRGSWWN